MDGPTRVPTGRVVVPGGPAVERRSRAPRIDATDPAWGVAFMAVAGAALIATNLAAAAIGAGATALVVLSGIATVVAAAAFVVLVVRHAHRWRPWMTHAGMVVGEGNLALLVLTGEGPVTSIGLAASFTLAAVFAGLYLPGRPVVAHVLVLAVVCVGAVVAAAGVGAGWSAALTIVPVSVLLAFLSHRLAGLLRQRSEQDPLTGLVNRRGLWRAAEELARTRHPRPWTVVVLDLDGFKQANDAFGHEFGDALLQQAAARWRPVVPRRGVLGRTGGDEFVVLLPVLRDEAVDVVARLRDLTPSEVGLSAGTAVWDRSLPLDASLRDADEALYRAKRAGKGITVEHGADLPG